MDQLKHDAVPTPALLAYWRAALADSCLSHPTIPKDCESIQIARNDNGMWRVSKAPKNWIDTTFAASKQNKSEEGEARKPIPLLLIPAIFAPESVHGVKRNSDGSNDTLVPLCIPCLLTPEGTLLPDGERLPWIPRALLEPTYRYATVGTLADLDAYLTQLPGKPQTLTDTLKVAEQLFTHVTERRLALLTEHPDDDTPALPLLEIEGYGVVDGWFGIAYEPPVMARHLIRLYDQLAQGERQTPLLESLAHLPDRRAQAPLPLARSAPRYKKIVGHINSKYPLSPSQHEAMVELLGLKNGEVLAVNGPPGTGKTTLLQSVVAQEWVAAAINDTPCPIIAATSTNVKAVENVLDSFAKLGKSQAHERWLPDIGGFGLFLASASRDSDHPTFNAPDQHYFLRFETPEWVARAKTYYLDLATRCPSLTGKNETVPEVVAGLRALLRSYDKHLRDLVALRYEIFEFSGPDESVGAMTGIGRVAAMCQSQIKEAEQEIARAQSVIENCREKKRHEQTRHERQLQEIKQVELAWNTYLGLLPSFLLDLFSFLPPVRRRRNARDRAFLLSSPLTNELRHRDDGLVEKHFAELIKQEKSRARTALRELGQAEHAAADQSQTATTKRATFETQLNEAEALRKKWRALLDDDVEDMEDVSLFDLNDKLDISVRAPMFRFADWYWSGCWLMEMDARFRDGSKDSKAPQKLETMLRRFAKIAPCMVSNFHMLPAFFCGWMGSQAIPLWNVIDLLIVDEAGQVSPEIGAPGFALAKRAVVVGDVHQIEPIWNVTEGIDRANAAKFGLIEKWDDAAYLKIEEDGYTAAKGNLMHMGARACRLQKYPDLRGLMLTEHRRCVPELIDYCNELVYGGRLDPLRKALRPDQRILPPFGYLAVTGQDQQVGGSRKNVAEAHKIVDWIVEHRARLENHYRDEQSNQPRHISQIIGIVTPFSPQAALIASLIKKRLPDTKNKGKSITVGTVHRLQGAEREIVLFSAVYGQDHRGGMFFDKGRNMMNVAVSRAKDSFLVFGNIGLFNPHNGGSSSGLLARYLFRHAENDLARSKHGQRETLTMG